MDKITFKVTDDSVNRKGYIVLTQGIDSTEFNDNNVLLFNHDLNQPIGLANYYTENSEGFADVYFDEDDAEAVKIKGKVLKGHLKTTSISISFNGADVLLNEDGVPVISKSRLREISITPIPANKNAVLQNSDEMELSFSIEELKNKKDDSLLYLNAEIVIDEELSASASEILTDENEINNDNMILEQFNVATEEELLIKFNELNASIAEKENNLAELNSNIQEKENIILALNEKSAGLEIEKAELISKLNDFQNKEKSDYINNAILEGKFNDNQKESLLKLSEVNFDLVKEMIDNAAVVKAPKVNLSDKLEKKSEEDRTKWSISDWRKNDPKGLLEIKNSNAAEFENIINKK